MGQNDYVGSISFNTNIQNVLSDLDKTINKVEQLKSASSNIGRNIPDSALNMNRLFDIGKLNGAGQAIKAINDAEKNLSSSSTSIIGTIAQRALMWGTVGAAIYKTIGLIGDLIKEEGKLDAATRNVQANFAPDFGSGSFDKAKQAISQSIDIARQTKAPVNETIEAVENLTKKFKDLKDVQALTSAGGILTNIGGGSVNDNVKGVITAMEQYGLKIKDVTEITDKWAAVTSHSSATLKDLQETAKTAGALGGSIGLNMDQINAMVGVLSNSQFGGGATGQFIDRLAKTFASKQGSSAVESVGIKTRNVGDMLDQLSSKWSSLNPTQQSSVIEGLGGRGTGPDELRTLMMHYHDFIDYLKDQTNSLGEASSQNETKMSGVSGQWNELIANAVRFASDLDGVSGAFVKVLTTLNGILSGIDDWLEKHKNFGEKSTHAFEMGAEDTIGHTAYSVAQIFGEKRSYKDFMGVRQSEVLGPSDSELGYGEKGRGSYRGRGNPGTDDKTPSSGHGGSDKQYDVERIDMQLNKSLIDNGRLADVSGGEYDLVKNAVQAYDKAIKELATSNTMAAGPQEEVAMSLEKTAQMHDKANKATKEHKDAVVDISSRERAYALETLTAERDRLQDISDQMDLLKSSFSNIGSQFLGDQKENIQGTKQIDADMNYQQRLYAQTAGRPWYAGQKNDLNNINQTMKELNKQQEDLNRKTNIWYSTLNKIGTAAIDKTVKSLTDTLFNTLGADAAGPNAKGFSLYGQANPKEDPLKTSMDTLNTSVVNLTNAIAGPAGTASTGGGLIGVLQHPGSSSINGTYNSNGVMCDANGNPITSPTQGMGPVADGSVYGKLLDQQASSKFNMSQALAAGLVGAGIGQSITQSQGKEGYWGTAGGAIGGMLGQGLSNWISNYHSSSSANIAAPTSAVNNSSDPNLYAQNSSATTSNNGGQAIADGSSNTTSTASSAVSSISPVLGIAFSAIGGYIGSLFDSSVDPLQKPLADLASNIQGLDETIQKNTKTINDTMSTIINAPSNFVLPIAQGIMSNSITAQSAIATPLQAGGKIVQGGLAFLHLGETVNSASQGGNAQAMQMHNEITINGYNKDPQELTQEIINQLNESYSKQSLRNGSYVSRFS